MAAVGVVAGLAFGDVEAVCPVCALPCCPCVVLLRIGPRLGFVCVDDDPAVDADVGVDVDVDVDVGVCAEEADVGEAKEGEIAAGEGCFALPSFLPLSLSLPSFLSFSLSFFSLPLSLSLSFPLSFSVSLSFSLASFAAAFASFLCLCIFCHFVSSGGCCCCSAVVVASVAVALVAAVVVVAVGVVAAAAVDGAVAGVDDDVEAAGSERGIGTGAGIGMDNTELVFVFEFAFAPFAPTTKDEGKTTEPPELEAEAT